MKHLSYPLEHGVCIQRKPPEGRRLPSEAAQRFKVIEPERGPIAPRAGLIQKVIDRKRMLCSSNSPRAMSLHVVVYRFTSEWNPQKFEVRLLCTIEFEVRADVFVNEPPFLDGHFGNSPWFHCVLLPDHRQHA